MSQVHNRKGPQRTNCATRIAKAVCVASVALAMFAASHASVGLTVRSMADNRLWQTVADRSAPLAWPWHDGAAAAIVSFSNRLDGAFCRVAVAREEAAPRGACTSPVASAGEALVDMELLQTSEAGAVVSRETATVAYVPGAGGGPIAVRAKGAASWRTVPKPSVFACDPAWRGLAGISGYFIQLPIFPRFTIRIR